VKGVCTEVATIQQHIRDTFLTKLATSGSVDARKIDKLRELMGDGKKLKPDDVVRLFSSPAGDNLA
jgi:hypothetical protein